MGIQDGIDKIEQCIDSLPRLVREDAVHRELTANQMREKLWDVRNLLATSVVWIADAPKSKRLTTSPKQLLLTGTKVKGEL